MGKRLVDSSVTQHDRPHHNAAHKQSPTAKLRRPPVRLVLELVYEQRPSGDETPSSADGLMASQNSKSPHDWQKSRSER
jgi:hypothetical protein